MSARAGRQGQGGFTLLELVVAMTVFGLVALGIFGVLVLGARSAGSGERVSEQARRFRMATEVMARQVASAEPIQLPRDDERGLGEDDERTALPFFIGFPEEVEFATAAPQRPDASGLSIIRYWLEDDMLRMSERPVYTAYAAAGRFGRVEEQDMAVTTLLYDVGAVTFAYQRESDSDEWLDEWDAADEDMLPACIRIDVRPSVPGGPDYYHELPIMVGVFNQVADADGDFRARRVRRDTASQRRRRQQADEDGQDDGDDIDDDEGSDDDEDDDDDED